MADDIATPGALHGVVVADFSRVLAGPLAGMTLGDLGADVIKVERPGCGDDTRAWGPPWHGDTSTYYLAVNRNKRSVALDLDNAADREIAVRLIARADVVIENFMPGRMTAYGLGYAAMAKRNPRLVYCSISGFGSVAAAAGMPGYDFLIQAMSGLMSFTGASTGAPTKVGVAVVDVVTGLNATVAILAALHARAATGLGQHVEVSLLSSALALLVNQGSGYLNAGVVPQRLGNQHPSIAPYQLLDTADGQLAIAVGSQRTWQSLCHALGLDDLASDQRFVTNEVRVVNIADLAAILNARLATKPTSEWVEILARAGVPAGRVNDVAEAFEYANTLGIDPVASLPVQGGATVQMVRSPMHMNRTPPTIRRPPPALDQHGAEVRSQLADSEDL